MRVLYVQQHFATDRGQAGVRGYRLVRAFVDRGHEVTVLTGHNWRDESLDARGKGVVEEELDGFRLVKIPVFYSQHQSFAQRVASFLKFARRAGRVAERYPADLCYASSTPLTVSLPARRLRKRKGVPYVFEVRDLWPDLPVEMGILRNPVLKRVLYAYEKAAYAEANRLVALAPGIRNGILEKSGRPADDVLMIPNGSDTAGLEPLPPRPRRHLDVPEDHLVLGYCGTHGNANGLDAVLDAAAELQRRGVDDVTFALVGDGREKERLVARARDEGLANVRFENLVGKDRYGEVLADLDVGMQILRNIPGFRYGTSPNKFFDYLAAGRPVLVNYPGWMSDLVTEHGCGLAVPPDDPGAFADAVEDLRRRRNDLGGLGEAARGLAEAEFSQERLLPRLVEWVEESL
ncbi:MAG: glycosyltransferase family 4 protein [Planctomycetota bacterium]|jgi:glycosyltransferase involved in cell wall biosynthesis